MSKAFKEMLDHPDKKASEATGILARIWRIMLGDLKISYEVFNRLLIAWNNDPSNGIPRLGKAYASERGNLMKEFERPDITWKVFLKGIKFLRPRKMTIRIDLEWDDPSKTSSRVTVHELHVPVNSINLENEQD